MNIKMILTNPFDPDPRVFKEAKSLIKYGYNLEVLCWDREGKYLNQPIEVNEGIIIKRFYAKGQYGSGYKQLFGFISFKNEVMEYIKNSNTDIIHCHDFDALYIGNRVKKKINKKIKLIYDEHDLFHLYFKRRQGIINKILSKLILFIEKKMLRTIDAHIVVTEKMSDLYNEETKIIYNAPLVNSFNTISKINREKLNIGFVGTVRYFNELKLLMDVAITYEEDISVFIAGGGYVLERLEKYVKLKGYNNVTFYGPYKMLDLQELYRQVDLMYMVYPTRDATISMPNKFFESILTETPMIVNYNTEFGKIVNDQFLGFILFQDFREELNKILFNVIKNKKIISEIKRNLKKVKDKYSWEQQELKLINLYRKLN